MLLPGGAAEVSSPAALDMPTVLVPTDDGVRMDPRDLPPIDLRALPPTLRIERADAPREAALASLGTERRARSSRVSNKASEKSRGVVSRALDVTTGSPIPELCVIDTGSEERLTSQCGAEIISSRPAAPLGARSM